MHANRTRAVLAGEGLLRARHRAVLDSLAALELRAYSAASLLLTASDADRGTLSGALEAFRKQKRRGGVGAGFAAGGLGEGLGGALARSPWALVGDGAKNSIITLPFR